MLKTLLIRLLLILIILLISFSPSFAKSFSSSLRSTYTIDLDGNTSVNHHFGITNLNSREYIDDYVISIGSEKIDSVTAYGVGELAITPTVVSQNGNTNISLQFGQPVVGVGKTKQFNLEYVNSDISQKTGQVLEVSIPVLGNQEMFSKVQSILRVPITYGKPNILIPQPTLVSDDGYYTILQYTPEQVQHESISVLFGDQQVFDLSLRYSLQNQTITPIVTQIALPPDTPYQKLYYHSIDPLPQTVDQDADGNWIATYQLSARSEQVVTVNAQVITYLEPKVDALVIKPTSKHLENSSYWEVSGANIERAVKNYQDPASIFQFVVSELNYNYLRIDHRDSLRLGAVGALNNPDNALCLEFADLFIALLRSNNYPARLLTGYAYTENTKTRPLSLRQDVLHAWAEYYDKEKGYWIPVDPTWTNTTNGVDYFNKLDLNHIVFAINGISSNQPLAAGLYKTTDLNSRDVLVNYSTTVPSEIINFNTEVNLPVLTKFGLSRQANLLIHNKSNIAYHQQVVTFGGVSETSSRISVLPYASIILPITLNNNWRNQLDKGVSIKIKDYNDTYYFSYTKFVYYLPQIILAIAGLPLVALSIFGAWRLLVYRRQ